MSTNLPVGRSFVCSVEDANIYGVNPRGFDDYAQFARVRADVAPEVIFVLRVHAEVDRPVPSMTDKAAARSSRGGIRKTIGKTVVVLAESRSFRNEQGQTMNYSEVTWRRIEPFDRIQGVSREMALSLLRKTWSICRSEKRPYEKVDEILNMLQMLETL